MAYLLLLPGMAWLAVFFVVPLITLFLTALQTRVPGGLTGQYEQTFRFMNFVDVLSRPQFLESLWRSFLYASSATVIALLIGYPLAYTIALKAGRWKAVMLVMVIAPFFVSFILRTIAWRQILTDEGPVVGFLNALGVPIGSIYPSAIAVVAGLAYNFLPFMTLPIFASLERLDVRLVEAAGDLYSSPFTAFRKVTLPLSMPGVVAGTLLTFIPAAGDYINATLLGNQRTTMLGNVIDSRFLNVVDYPTAAVLSFTLMAFILTLVFFYVRRIGSEELV
jgi:spermidine/putrescine transport system permease protein